MRVKGKLTANIEVPDEWTPKQVESMLAFFAGNLEGMIASSGYNIKNLGRVMPTYELEKVKDAT